MLESAAVQPSLILLNGNVVTLDPEQPRVSAIVCRAGEIVYIGDDADAHSLRDSSSQVIDLRGRLVLPAFTDSHIHFAGFAQSLDEVNLEGCRSLDEAVVRVAERVRSAREDEVIHGTGWNHRDWVVPVFPDKHVLDRVAPRHPVILTRKDGHSVWVNSAALERAGITRQTPDPMGGVLDRDASGEPTGLLRENAIDLLGRGLGTSSEEIPDELLLRAIAHAHRAGLAAIHNIESANALRAFQRLHARGKLTLRVVHSIPDTKVEHAARLGLARGFGDEWLRLQAIKIFADGSLGSQTAELREPFVGQPDNRGVPVTPREQMLERARCAVETGLDVWIHAIGDAAIARTLDVFETLRGEGYRDAILRIEHAQHLHPSDVPRFARANVIASMQPIHQPSDMQMAEALLGRERARYSYAFRSLEQAGAELAFGSDCPVERLDPLHGIHAAVTRQNVSGEPPEGWFPEERIPVQSAVRAFTQGAAIAANDIQRGGTLSVGKRADVVVLSNNIFEIPPREILNTRVDFTIVGGQVVSAHGE